MALRAAPDGAPLVDDPGFRRGLRVWSPQPGAHREVGVIQPPGAAAQPDWGVAQWYSRFSLSDAPCETLPDGAYRFFDGAKSVTFGQGLVLALNGRTEYQGRLPERGDPWPHLLVEGPLSAHPRLPALRAVPFGIEYRLLRSETLQPPGFDAARHTAQFLLHLTIQNANRESKILTSCRSSTSRWRLPGRADSCRTRATPAITSWAVSTAAGKSPDRSKSRCKSAVCGCRR
jgi:hypothetical protein